MPEPHTEIDLCYIYSGEEDQPELQPSVKVDEEKKKNLREIKETMEAERNGGFTEQECRRVLEKAGNLHAYTEWFVSEEDSPVAPGALLGLYNQIFREIGVMKRTEKDRKLLKKAGSHFLMAHDLLADADVSAQIYRGNYDYDASTWNPRAAEGQINNPLFDFGKVGEVEPYESNLN